MHAVPGQYHPYAGRDRYRRRRIPFLYAAFLQEASQYLSHNELGKLSERCTKMGDQWRHFAYSAARICKARESDLVSYKALSKLLHAIGDTERQFFKDLKAVKY